MKNPWLDFIHQRPFILEKDRVVIADFNKKTKNGAYKIQDDQPPAPFVGNRHAPIVLLNLNPGYNKEDNKFYEKKAFIKASENNLKHKKNAYPFYFLDPSLGKNSGYTWWHKKLKELISEFKEKAVSQNILVLEYFPYHSIRFNNSKKLFSCAQEYTIFLLKEALKRKALVIIMRSKEEWYKLVPNLKKYKLHCVLKNPQNVTISPRNMPDGWFDKVKNKF